MYTGQLSSLWLYLEYETPGFAVSVDIPDDAPRREGDTGDSGHNPGDMLARVQTVELFFE